MEKLVINPKVQNAINIVNQPLPKKGWGVIFRRFLRAFVPQIPAAIIIGIKTDNFWVGFGLSLLAAAGTALDKLLRFKSSELKKEA